VGDGSHDPTLADTTDPVPRTSEVTIDTRYDLGAVLGRGGMGEVRTAKDTRIHRDVAVKLLRSAKGDKDTVARFLREAQVQGALEHPAVPPVHDLGVDGDGQPYFVMKKLAGTTLFEVLEARSSSELVKAKWTRRALLTRLVDVCLAIEFAHTKGIVHRDLKPANIMLGDFGETYVLDWGLARITNNDLAVATPSPELVPGQTVAGALLGTPGYMAPEQARGEDVDARADVYALGCILFELLTGVQALPRGLPAIEATLLAVEHRPRKRVDVPPELDELCARATAQERVKRPTARQLADGIQAYLDGDRDHEARRTLASDHVATARRLLDQTTNEAPKRCARRAAHSSSIRRTAPRRRSSHRSCSSRRRSRHPRPSPPPTTSAASRVSTCCASRRSHTSRSSPRSPRCSSFRCTTRGRSSRAWGASSRCRRASTRSAAA
jgi:serine/threonine-protein kinase